MSIHQEQSTTCYNIMADCCVCCTSMCLFVSWCYLVYTISHPGLSLILHLDILTPNQVQHFNTIAACLLGFKRPDELFATLGTESFNCSFSTEMQSQGCDTNKLPAII